MHWSSRALIVVVVIIGVPIQYLALECTNIVLDCDAPMNRPVAYLIWKSIPHTHTPLLPPCEPLLTCLGKLAADAHLGDTQRHGYGGACHDVPCVLAEFICYFKRIERLIKSSIAPGPSFRSS